MQITVPQPIQCVNLITKEPLLRDTEPDPPWSLYRALAIFVAQRPEWFKPIDKCLRLMAFLSDLEATPIGKTVMITEELHREICDTIKSLDFGIPYPYNIQLPPLFLAVLAADG